MALLRTGKNLQVLPERLASLGIMGAQFRTPFKPLNTIVLRFSGDFRGAPYWSPSRAKRNVNLSGSQSKFFQTASKVTREDMREIKFIR